MLLYTVPTLVAPLRFAMGHDDDSDNNDDGK